MFWFNETEKNLGGSVHDLYSTERDNILAMRREYLGWLEVLPVQYRLLHAPQFYVVENLMQAGRP